MPPNSPRRPGLLPPEGTTFCWNPLLGPSGPGCYLHPLFTKYTPLLCFFADSFLKRYRTLRITQGHPFSFWNVAKLYGLCNNALFDFRNVGELYGLCNNAFFRLPECCETLRIVHQYFLLFSGMSRNFTNCPMMGAKHLTRIKQRSHVIKQRSPDEIRV